MLLTLEAPVSTSADVGDARNALQKAQQLLSIADDGSAVFQTENEELTLVKRIARIDAERGGLLALKHETLGQEEAVEEAPEGDRPTAEELLKIKEEMYWRLERNRLSILTGWNLLQQVLPLPPSAASDPPPNLLFPHETFGTTLLDLPLVAHTADERLRDASFSLARRQSDLKAGADRLRAASTALQASVDRSSRNWETWLSWADRGRVQAASVEPFANFRDALGVSRAAKNLLAYFGFDEAAERIRGSSYAGLDDEGQTVLHPRRKGRRRLILRVRLDANGPEAEAVPGSAQGDDLLAAAREEVFDEELFAQICDEAKGGLGVVGEDTLDLPLSQGGHLHLAMTAIDSLPESSEAGALATLLRSYLSLRMVALYKFRRRVKHPQTAALPPASLPIEEPPRLLAPMLSLLALHIRASRLLATLQAIASALPDGDAAVSFAPTDPQLEQVLPKMGAVATLHLPGNASVHARLSTDITAIALEMPGGRTASPATESLLRPALEHEVRRAYASEVGKRLSWDADEARGRVMKGSSTAQLSFDVDSGLDCIIDSKSFRRDGQGRSLFDWLRDAT